MAQVLLGFITFASRNPHQAWRGTTSTETQSGNKIFEMILLKFPISKY